MTDGPSSISRRGFTRTLGAAGVAAVATTSLSSSPAAAAEREFRAARGSRPTRRPNLLVILADDLGWADLSSYGSPDIRTPNLDRLAASGVRFTQGYSASAVCSPNRVALYTGRYPARIPGGLPEPIGAATPQNGIPTDHPTLASLVKGAGYDTAMFGKWHGGFLPWFGPLKSGWDEFVGNYSGGLDYFSKYSSGPRYDLFDGEEELQDPRYYTDIITERSVEYIRRKHERPWLLNVNFTTPHWPWEGPGDKAVSDELTARLKGGESGALFHTDGGNLEVYKAMVESLDDSVGQVLGALKKSGQLENTVVFFASDNGGERFSYQWPLTGNKVDLTEGGIRVPTILSWPGQIRSRQVSHEPVHTLDWHATFVELAGANEDPAYPTDGTSLVDYLLRGRTVPERDLFWRMRGQRGLRRGDLKYVQQSDGVDRLHDLSVDPSEQANLAKKRPTDLASLRSAWESVNAELLPY